MEDGLFAQVCQELAAKKIKLNRQLQKPPATKKRKDKNK